MSNMCLEFMGAFTATPILDQKSITFFLSFQQAGKGSDVKRMSMNVHLTLVYMEYAYRGNQAWVTPVIAHLDMWYEPKPCYHHSI